MSPLARDHAHGRRALREHAVLVYIVLIFIRILMSWIPRIPYNRFCARS